MNEELSKLHEQEWDTYLKGRNETYEQLTDDELLIRMHHGFDDKTMNPAWRDKLQRDRKGWTEEWGVNGRRETELRDRHAVERKEALTPDLQQFKEELQTIRERQKGLRPRGPG